MKIAYVTALTTVLLMVTVVATAAEPPSSVAEAHERLSKIFGEPQDPPKLTRFAINEEIVTQPDRSGPKVIVVNKGQEFFTHPHIDGASVVLSQNEVLARDVFNESKEGTRTLNRHLDRTYALETRITYFSGLWIAQRRLVNHSLGRFNGMTISTGTVEWLDNGIKLTMSGFDTLYAPDGSVRPKAYVSADTYSIKNGRVAYNSVFQAYQAVSDPNGAQLLVPDFSRPSGEPIIVDRLSEPRAE